MPAEIPEAVKNQPVFVVLNGVGLLVSGGLGVAQAFGVIDRSTEEIVSQALAVQVFANAVAGVIWPFVTPNNRVPEIPEAPMPPPEFP